MARYEIALIVTVEAADYPDAENLANEIAESIAQIEQLPVSAVFAYEHDNDGQRVVYLHPKTEPRDE